MLENKSLEKKESNENSLSVYWKILEEMIEKNGSDLGHW